MDPTGRAFSGMTSATQHQRVLVIDDDPDKRLALGAVLRPLQLDVVEASSGVDALRILMTQDFAVILLDVRMPGMNGFETASLIRQRRESESTPIIFITAYDRDEVSAQPHYESGAVDFIYGPVSPDELRAKVSVFTNLFAKTNELQAAADQFRLVADVAPIGIFQTDADDRYIYTNPCWSRTTGIAAEDAYGTVWGTVLHPQTAAGVPVHLADTDLSGVGIRVEIELDGVRRTLVATSTVVRDSAGGITGRIGTVADVTAEAQIEAALSLARDRATEASTLKSDFLANMSHEIRTPMNGVIGMTDLLLETDLDATQRDYAQTVRNSGEVLLAIINDILDFSKIEAGKLEVEVIDFNVRALVDELAKLLSRAAEAKDLELRVTFEPDVPCLVAGDAGRLRQVLTNLISNSLKFTECGHVDVHVKCEHRETGDIVLRFDISDTGVGISDDKLSRIFEPFTQGDASTSRKYGGTGLGLAISSQLVKLMGGDCGVSSAVGAGSVFWFTAVVLPANDRAPLGTDVIPPRPAIAHSGCSRRLLLAEDNPINEKVARAMLAFGGFQVDTVHDGAAAVAAVENNDYDAVLMDCQMPELNGYEATKLIRAHETDGRHVPIIAMTAGARREDRDLCIASGMDDYISKPVSKDTLIAVLAQWVGRNADL